MSATAPAALAAVAWGSAGLVAGVASRSRPALAVAVFAQGAGILPLLAFALAGAEPLGLRAAAFGSAGGAVSSVGLVWLYRAFAGPAVGLAAPVAACGILVPVAAGAAGGEPLGGAQIAGAAVIVLGLAAVLGVGRGRAHTDAEVLRLAVGAALTFGAFYLALDAGSEGAGAAWTTLSARIGAVVALSVQAVRTRTFAGLRPGRWAVLACGAGGVDSLGNLAYATATAAGSLSIVSLVSAAYPAVSVLLAVVWLRERITPLRLAEVLATVLGLGLVALPS